VRAIREQVASALDLVIHQERLRDGSRRLVRITEVIGMEGDIITLQDLFAFDFKRGQDEHGRFMGALLPTGIRPRCLDKLSDAGVSVPLNVFQLGEHLGRTG
jgi:pilus assembly protein CpaF